MVVKKKDAATITQEDLQKEAAAKPAALPAAQQGPITEKINFDKNGFVTIERPGMLPTTMTKEQYNASLPSGSGQLSPLGLADKMKDVAARRTEIVAREQNIMAMQQQQQAQQQIQQQVQQTQNQVQNIGQLSPEQLNNVSEPRGEGLAGTALTVGAGTAGAVAGGLAGATTGATIGTALAPVTAGISIPVGTAAGAVIGAVAGAGGAILTKVSAQERQDVKNSYTLYKTSSSNMAKIINLVNAGKMSPIDARIRFNEELANFYIAESNLKQDTSTSVKRLLSGGEDEMIKLDSFRRALPDIEVSLALAMMKPNPLAPQVSFTDDSDSNPIE